MERSTLHPAVRPLTDLDTLGELRDPILVAAFSGSWGATAGAALALVTEQWGATPVAEIDPEEFFDFTAARPTVRLEDGERVIDWPENRVYLARPEGAERDLLILAGAEPALRWRTFAAALGSLLSALGVQDSLIVSAFPGGTPHTREVPLRVYGAHEQFAERLGLTPWTPDYQGPTSFGGYLGVEHRERGIRSSSISAVAPFYIQVEPRPHAVRALVHALDRVFGTTTEVSDLDRGIEAVNAQAVEALARSEQYRELLATLEQQYDASAVATATRPDVTPLDSDEILRDVEAFFDSRGDMSGPGTGRGSQQS